jgi:hypothetical protein
MMCVALLPCPQVCCLVSYFTFTFSTLNNNDIGHSLVPHLLDDTMPKHLPKLCLQQVRHKLHFANFG